MKSLWDSVLWLRRKNKQDKEEILTAVNAVQNLFKTSGEATASASDIVAPKTAYNGTTLITGTIADKTGTSEYAATASIDNTNKKIKMQVPADGKYGTKNYLYQSFSNIASLIGLTASKLVKNNTVLGITGNSSNMDTSSCDAAAAQILSGKKAGVKGNIVTGTMVNRAGTTVQAAAVTQDDDNTYFAVPEAAYYDKNSKIATANSNLSKQISFKKLHSSAQDSGITNVSVSGYSQYLLVMCYGSNNDNPLDLGCSTSRGTTVQLGQQRSSRTSVAGACSAYIINVGDKNSVNISCRYHNNGATMIFGIE